MRRLVVDVSCEVAQLPRIVSVPTVVVRQHGGGWDPGHRARLADLAASRRPAGWLTDLVERVAA